MATDNDAHALSLDGLKILAVFIVLLAGFLGAAAPVIFAYCFREKEQQRNIQTVIKVMTCLSVGIVLATAMIHMLPEGLINLKEGGNPIFADHEEEVHNETAHGGNDTHHDEGHDDHDHPYPFGFLFAMIGIAVVYIISTEINWYGTKKLKELEGVECDEEEEERQAAMIKLYLLEVGIAVHSVIIGITMGLSASYNSASTLFIVLCIHQFFEGLAIGSLAVMAQVTFTQAAGFVVTFALTTPVGIAIGLGIAKHGHANQTAQGILETMSAGILLHMALVEMLPHIFGTHSHHAHGPLPLAKLHDHIHHGHGHSHGGDGGCHGHGHGHGGDGVHPRPATGDASAAAAAAAAPGTAIVPSNIGYGTVEHSKVPSQLEEPGSEQQQNIVSSPAEQNRPGSQGTPRADDAAAELEDPRMSSASENPLRGSSAQGQSRRSSRPGSAANTRQSIAQIRDDHEDDESLGLRIVCYLAFIAGISVQSVLGIWA